jgi:hypothetical protein
MMLLKKQLPIYMFLILVYIFLKWHRVKKIFEDKKGGQFRKYLIE